MSQTYVVKSGDSLSKIASQFNVKGGYMELAKYNGISNPNFISVGQTIKIPGTTSASSSSTSSGGGSIGVGSKVKITGSKYATGQSIPSWVKNNTYTVSQISGSKALIKEIVSWVYTKDLQLIGGGTTTKPQQQPSQPQQPASSTNTGSVGVGSKVKITGSKYATGQSIPSWVKNNTYTVSQISGSKALIKEIVSWVYVKDLQLVSGGTQSQPQQQPSQPQQPAHTDGGGIEPKPNTGASSLASSSVNFGTINSNARQNKVSKITIHHMAGNMGARACANMHKNGSASANYYIGSDGAICSGVAENRRAWTSSSGANDHQAITMEVANNAGAPNWTISDAAYNSMIALCRDICSRYGISPHFDGSTGASLTAHYMFASTACPGPYIKGKLKNGEIENDIKGSGSGKKQQPQQQQQNNTGSASVQTYTVKSGDTLSGIASKFGVVGGYMALAQYNGISNPNAISVGQVIKIPSGSVQGKADAGSTVKEDKSSGGYPNVATGNIRPIYDYIVNNIYSDHPAKKSIAAGFLGNIYTESHYQPGAEQNPGKADRGGKGICQWDDRKYNLYSFCGASYSEKDKWAVLGKQLDFLKHELNGTEGSAHKKIKNSVSSDSVASARAAALVIAQKFERCAWPENPERQNKAEENYKNL